VPYIKFLVATFIDMFYWVSFSLHNPNKTTSFLPNEVPIRKLKSAFNTSNAYSQYTLFHGKFNLGIVFTKIMQRAADAELLATMCAIRRGEAYVHLSACS